MGVAEGNRNSKCAAEAEDALDGRGSPMQSRELSHQGEADATALVCPAMGPLDAVEPLEHAWHLKCGNADAGIRHGQRRGTVVLARTRP